MDYIVLTAEEENRLFQQQELFHTWLGKRTSYKPEEVPEGLHDISNEARSLIETYRFLQEQPQKYVAYVSEKEKTVTTWMGDYLGSCSFGALYRSNMGDKRISISVKAINGLTYYGTYYRSAGDYCRLTATKV